VLNFEINQAPGMHLGFSARRPGQGDCFDFSPGVAAFVPMGTAKTPTLPLDEMTGLFAGTYFAHYGPTPGADWWGGDITITIHDLGTKLADGTTTRPCALISFNAPFERGDSRYAPAPFLTY
jgi:hypothetical protein